MTKTSLSPEDVEQIKQSKGKLSAAEVQRRYNIGWGRLQKLWNGANQEPVTRDVPTTKQDIAQKEELQREIERVTQVQTPQREIVVEDFFARLGQLEANMETQTTQMEKQTELLHNILDSLDAVSNIESDTQSILEQENRESYTLQDIGRSIQEYIEYTKTIVYSAVLGFAALVLFRKTWKQAEKETSAQTTPAPTTPAPTKTLFGEKKKPDVFAME